MFLNTTDVQQDKPTNLDLEFDMSCVLSHFKGATYQVWYACIIQCHMCEILEHLDFFIRSKVCHIKQNKLIQSTWLDVSCDQPMSQVIHVKIKNHLEHLIWYRLCITQCQGFVTKRQIYVATLLASDFPWLISYPRPRIWHEKEDMHCPSRALDLM